MKEQIYLLSLLFISSTILTSQSLTNYLGEELPKAEAKIFAAGIVSTGLNERDIAITPDQKEIYWSTSIGNNSITTILFSKYINSKWTDPEIANFAKNLNFMFIEPAISPDGNKFYFSSDMKIDPNDTLARNIDIWVMDRNENDWGKPYNIGAPINSDGPEFFPSITNDMTIYFTRDNPDGTSSILRSKFVDGKYQNPELLPEQVNAGRSRYNAFISRDESYIITPIFGLPDSHGATDYYISFRDKNDTWQGPFNMGQPISSESRNEWSAYVSPDEKHIFFMSARKNYNKNNLSYADINRLKTLANSPENGNSDIYWISSNIIDSLRNVYVK